MNSGNSKTSDPHRLLLKLLDKINLMNHILYQIFKIILDHLKKKHDAVTDNPSIMI